MIDLRPIPTPEEVRATGWTGDVTRFPLSHPAFLYRCQVTGANPESPPNAAWYYAPNAWVQRDLHERGLSEGLGIPPEPSKPPILDELRATEDKLRGIKSNRYERYLSINRRAKWT